jgi:circadian clock protein KaiC
MAGMEEEEVRQPIRPAQVATGVPGLDRLLGGGVRRGGLHVVVGGPGMGKSVLAHQIGAHLVREGGRVLYLTSLVETHETLIAQARSFRFFDPRSVPGSFYYASLYPVMAKGGLSALREEITRLVGEHDPALVILDGVHALKVVAENSLDYQRFIHDLEAQSAVTGMTTLLLAHPPNGGLATDPTFTIADAVFHMRSRRVMMREIRMFSVGKLRGVNHISGWHTFRITEDGIRLFPRTEALVAHMSEVSGSVPEMGEPERLVTSGIPGLDEMLGGGISEASVTLLVGTPGSGKTLAGLAFLCGGEEQAGPGLMIGYHELPASLVRKGEAAGIPIARAVAEGRVHLHWRSPGELLADEEIERLLASVEEHGIRRVVIDAVEDLRHAIIPPTRTVYVLAALANLLRERGVTTVLVQGLPRIAGVNFDLPMADLSATLDNVVHIRSVEREGELRRLIAILKVRARAHDRALREFRIDERGLGIGKPFDATDQVLTGMGISR